MKMTLLWLALGAGLSATTTVPAPPTLTTTPTQQDPPGDPQQAMRELTKNLKLTAAQQKQVDGIQKTQLKQMQDLRSKNPNATPEQLQARGRQITANTDAKMKAVLTATQYRQYQANVAQMTKDLPTPPQSSDGTSAATTNAHPDLAELTAGLTLTPEQQTRVNDIHTNQMRQVDALRNGGGSPFSMMSKVRAIDDEANAQYKKLLSGDQYDRLVKNKEGLRRKQGMPGR